MIVVRFAHPNEDAIVSSIVDEAFQSVRKVYNPRSSAVPVDKDDAYEARSIVALINDVSVGSAIIYAEPQSLRISQLAVLPNYQRRGVASQLILFAGRAACDLGLTELRLNTIEETGNVTVFQKLGFSIVGTSEATWCTSDRFSKLTDVEMSRQLNLGKT